MVERAAVNRLVVGSNPTAGANPEPNIRNLAPCARVPWAVRPALLANAFCLLAAYVMVGCMPPTDGTLRVHAVAGPACPVVSDPPDPACADGPVDGAEVAVLDQGGGEVRMLVTDADGQASVSLPAGRYTVVPQPVDGLLGTAPPTEVVVPAQVDAEPVTLVYDTGIR